MPDSAQPNLTLLNPPLTRSFYLALILTGVLSGLTGGLLMRLLFLVERLSFPASTNFLLAVAAASPTRKLVVLLAAGLLAGMASLLIARLKGDTDLSAAVWFRQGRQPLLKASLRALLSIVVVGMGAAVGRENSLKQAGGVLANILANWRRLPVSQRRLLVACGAGAGMAAAYNVPLGAAAFTLEVLVAELSISTALAAVLCTTIAVATSWLLLPDAPTYHLPAIAASPAILLFAAITGPILGLAAVPFIRLLGWAKARKPHTWQLFALPVLSLLLLGLVAIPLPAALGNGKDVVQLAFDPVSITTKTLILLCLARPILTALLFRSGIPGGLFTPTMSFGASFGLLLGRLTNLFSPAPIPGPTAALLGAAALLAAAAQSPISAVLFIIELTRTADSAIVPILLAVVLATLTTRLFEHRSIYSIEAQSAATPAII